VAKARSNLRNEEPAATGGLWHQPTLLNLLADVLFACGGIFLAWAALGALQRLPVFPLREVVLVAPPAHVPVEQIEQAARSAVSGNFFSVDLAAVRNAFEALPWVRSATVRRVWPDGLELALEEHVAAARWRHTDGSAALVNAQGEVFAGEAPNDAAALPNLAGPAGSAAEVLARHAEFTATLADSGRHIVALTLSARRAWRMRLDDGLIIELGRDSQRQPIAARLARFVADAGNLPGRLGKLRSVDLRYPNGFAVSLATRAPRPAGAASPEQSS